MQNTNNKQTNSEQSASICENANVSCWAFNVNDHVKVRLTDLGYQYLADEHNEYIGFINEWEFRTPDYYKEIASKDNGYTTFQMWDFMQRFGGERIRVCQPNYFHLDIVFIAAELSPCS